MFEYQFGILHFNVKGNAAFFTMSDNLKSKIANMSLAEATQANKQAWTLKKSRNAICNKYNNVTIYGHDLYANSYFSYIVTEAVMKETYKRMLKG